MGLEGRFYMSPGNDRDVIARLTRILPLIRQQLHVNDMLLGLDAQDLRDVSYVRGSDNEIRKRRKPLDRLLRMAA